MIVVQLRLLRLLLVLSFIEAILSGSLSMNHFMVKHFYDYKTNLMQADNLNLKQKLQDSYSRQAYSALPRSCLEALENGKKSGVYKIFLPTSQLKPFFVYCLEDPYKQGAWTVIQRRTNDTINFRREWKDYKLGFGNLEGSHFLGLDKIHALTNSKLHQMWARFPHRINDSHDVKYDSFIVGDESTNYVVMSLGDQRVTMDCDAKYYQDTDDNYVLDPLRSIQEKMFSTEDFDNDENKEINCAKEERSGWWHKDCLRTFSINMNHPYDFHRRVSNIYPEIHMAIRPMV